MLDISSKTCYNINIAGFIIQQGGICYGIKDWGYC